MSEFPSSIEELDKQIVQYKFADGRKTLYFKAFAGRIHFVVDRYMKTYLLNRKNEPQLTILGNLKELETQLELFRADEGLFLEERLQREVFLSNKEQPGTPKVREHDLPDLVKEEEKVDPLKVYVDRDEEMKKPWMNDGSH